MRLFIQRAMRILGHRQHKPRFEVQATKRDSLTADRPSSINKIQRLAQVQMGAREVRRVVTSQKDGQKNERPASTEPQNTKRPGRP